MVLLVSHATQPVVCSVSIHSHFLYSFGSSHVLLSAALVVHPEFNRETLYKIAHLGPRGVSDSLSVSLSLSVVPSLSLSLSLSSSLSVSTESETVSKLIPKVSCSLAGSSLSESLSVSGSGSLSVSLGVGLNLQLIGEFGGTSGLPALSGEHSHIISISSPTT